jgi:hypothetical protein
MMTIKSRFREFVPVVVIFIIVNAIVISGRSWLVQTGISQDMIIGGNLFLFVITFFSFLLAERGLQKENPHAFVRAVYLSIMVKLFACIIAAFIYISINKSGVNKGGLFTCMGLYLVYTFVEVSALTKLLKKAKNG